VFPDFSVIWTDNSGRTPSMPVVRAAAAIESARNGVPRTPGLLS
jgi:hypothetical protein